MITRFLCLLVVMSLLAACETAQQQGGGSFGSGSASAMPECRAGELYREVPEAYQLRVTLIDRSLTTSQIIRNRRPPDYWADMKRAVEKGDVKLWSNQTGKPVRLWIYFHDQPAASISTQSAAVIHPETGRCAGTTSIVAVTSRTDRAMAELVISDSDPKHSSVSLVMDKRTLRAGLFVCVTSPDVAFSDLVVLDKGEYAGKQNITCDASVTTFANKPGARYRQYFLPVGR